MKVYLIYEGKDTSGNVVFNLKDRYKFKVDIPDSWLDAKCEKLLNLFIQQYTPKHPQEHFDTSMLQAKCGGILINNGDAIGRFIHEYNDVYILHKEVEIIKSDHKGEQLCTNYGCGKYFNEEDNSDKACHYHLKGPVFHDLEKYWGCCSEKKAYDWESFQLIKTCQIGRHSTSNKPFEFPKEQISNKPLTHAEQQALGAKNDAFTERRTVGPREFEGALHDQDKPQEVVNGQAKCRNFGCGKVFNVDENSDVSCRFHIQGPVFWDTYKYWKCCPGKKSAEFEEFVKIPGCHVGPHKI
ncbi:unnamed protein product [Phytomonas sp. EM1]|nr:unnamed protein product [Phytomonas sp. EM1]|eukprot:CCW65884.1 unnamed protein product [Phytomonas sp. isolate EM1]